MEKRPSEIGKAGVESMIHSPHLTFSREEHRNRESGKEAAAQMWDQLAVEIDLAKEEASLRGFFQFPASRSTETDPLNATVRSRRSSSRRTLFKLARPSPRPNTRRRSTSPTLSTNRSKSSRRKSTPSSTILPLASRIVSTTS